MQASASKKKFRPGELAPITGVYLVNHGMRHREQHEVVIIRGEQLPVCRVCKLNVTFEIVRPISHITHDWDFSGPHNLIIRPHHEDFRDTRMFRRVNVQWPVTLELSDTSSATTFHGHSVDVSAGGIGTILRHNLPSRYKAALLKILIDTGEKSLGLQAHLRYHTGLRYGFEFANVTQVEQEAIRRLLETQLQSSPGIPS